MLRFWEGDGALPVILALLVALIFIWPMLITPAHPLEHLRHFVFSALLLAGAMTTMRFRLLRQVRAVIVALALAVRWLAIAWPEEALLVLREASTLLLHAIFCVIVAMRVYRAGRLDLLQFRDPDDRGLRRYNAAEPDGAVADDRPGFERPNLPGRDARAPGRAAAGQSRRRVTDRRPAREAH